MAKIDSFGVQLQLGANDATATTPETFTTVAQLMTVTPPGINTAAKDVTTHDSVGGVMEKRPAALSEIADVSARIKYDPALGTHNNTTGLLFVARTKAVRNWKIIDPTNPATTTAFRGFISTFSREEMGAEGEIEASITITVVAMPTFP